MSKEKNSESKKRKGKKRLSESEMSEIQGGAYAGQGGVRQPSETYMKDGKLYYSSNNRPVPMG
jgi:hypothetical protein